MDLEAIKAHLELDAQAATSRREVRWEVEFYVSLRLEIDPRWDGPDEDQAWVYSPGVSSFSIDEEGGTVQVLLEARACGCGCSGYDRATFIFPLRHLWEEDWEKEIKAELEEISRAEAERKALEEAEEAERQEAREREKLAELKAKYE